MNVLGALIVLVLIALFLIYFMNSAEEMNSPPKNPKCHKCGSSRVDYYDSVTNDDYGIYSTIFFYKCDDCGHHYTA